MKFVVKDRTGRIMMQTEHPECIPTPAEQRELRAAGYKIKITGGTRDGDLLLAEMLPQVPGQLDIDGGQAPEPAIARVGHMGRA